MTKVEYYVSKGVKYSAKTGRKLTNQSPKSTEGREYKKVSKPDKFKKSKKDGEKKVAKKKPVKKADKEEKTKA